MLRWAAIAALSLAVAQCGQVSSKIDPRYGVSASPRVVQPGQPVPKGGGTYRVGRPYTVAGQTYVPGENAAYNEVGTASWYGQDFHGRLTANGEVYDVASISAAHPTLPIPSYVRVTNLANNRSIIVRVNDRGPYHQGRLIDLSVRTAKLLGFHGNGVARVRVEYVGRASLDGSDDSKLEATLRRGEPAPAPAMVAANRPMLPGLFESRTASRGAVPTPPDRPFDLGREEGPTRVAKRAPTSAQASDITRAPIAPVTASARTAARPVPAPKSAPAPYATPPSRFAAAESPTNFETRFAPVGHTPVTADGIEPRRTAPATAYAPVAPGRSDAALVSGRGLY
jgi:rare lipoprotein A